MQDFSLIVTAVYNTDTGTNIMHRKYLIIYKYYLRYIFGKLVMMPGSTSFNKMLDPNPKVLDEVKHVPNSYENTKKYSTPNDSIIIVGEINILAIKRVIIRIKENIFGAILRLANFK